MIIFIRVISTPPQVM